MKACGECDKLAVLIHDGRYFCAAHFPLYEAARTIQKGKDNDGRAEGRGVAHASPLMRKPK